MYYLHTRREGTIGNYRVGTKVTLRAIAIGIGVIYVERVKEI